MSEPIAKPSGPMIKVEELKKIYDMGGEVQVTALDGIDLTIQRNEYVAVMGPSGSGKSTLMNLIGCLDTPSRGEYCVDDICRATTVSPSISAMTVIIVPAMPISSVLASSDVPWKTSRCRGEWRGTETRDSTEPSPRASTTDSPGSTQSAPRTYSRIASPRRSTRAV